MQLARFLARGELRPSATILLLDARPERQYAGEDAQPNLLAQSAADRKAGQPLIVNYFRVYADHMVSDVGAALDLEALDDHTRQQVLLSVFYRALYGVGLLMRLDGRVHAPSPRGYWPLMDRGIRIGSVVVAPYATRGTAGSGLGSIANDRALAVEHVDGQASPVFDYELSGVTLGPVGARVGAVEGIGVHGGERSAYGPMEPIVERLDGILRSANRVAARQGAPHLQVPAASVQYDASGAPSLTFHEGGNVFPTARDDKDVKFVTLTADTSLFQFAFAAQLDALSAVCGLPRTIFGNIPLPRLDSTEALQQLNLPATEKSAVWVADLIRAGQAIGLTLQVAQDQEETPNGPESGSGTSSTDRGAA